MNIAFIGLGHMGSAIAAAMDKGPAAVSFYFADHHPERAAAFAAGLKNPSVITDGPSAAEKADWLFLAVKPQGMQKALAELQPVLTARAARGERVLLVTMAAGLEMKTVRAWAGVALPIVRMMPNTPVEVGCGCTEYCSDGVTEAELAVYEALLSGGGLLTRVTEDRIDASCALAGCGPAYVYMLIGALAEAGEELGLSPEDAVKMAAKTVEGAGRMVLETGRTPEDLKIAVCSPGGATIEGVRVLEAADFGEEVRDAIKAAYRRTLELR